MSHSHDTTTLTTGTSSSIHDMMVPYLHFTGGDFLFFKAWQPTSAGAIAGACIGLVMLAIIERWLSATRSVFNTHWRRRAFEKTAARDQVVTGRTYALVSEQDLVASHDIHEKDTSQAASPQHSANSNTSLAKRRHRTIAPFIAAHDIPRGVLYGLEMLIMYSLMLAVMTFQAAYLISIVLGLGIGEILFGRAVTGGH